MFDTDDNDELFGGFAMATKPTLSRSDVIAANRAERMRAARQVAEQAAAEEKAKAAAAEARRQAREAKRGRGARGGKSSFEAAAKGRDRLQIRKEIIKAAARRGRVSCNDVVDLFQDRDTGMWTSGVSDRQFSAQFWALEQMGYLIKSTTEKSRNTINRNASHDVNVYVLTDAGLSLVKELTTNFEDAAEALDTADFDYRPWEA